ncbi:hypothetical protein OMW55_03025 [Sphingomonas sp. BN140010]|uniref:Lipoprotein n=1 Tax=Sphingomonas arvum TaxID=2992113 RepID=A0ABT3JCI3_9SPHN|nr:hypothetical protein [Sphingomonas sp. BN140010]MCW3796779.1 hypothetical protein [Sphingomonas sp. BN140010]
MRSLAPLLLTLVLGACAGRQQPDEPSLAPRAAERIDPRVPVPDTSIELPASVDVRARLDRLLADVRNAQGGADAAISAAESAAARAGARSGEAWVQAQQLLSAAIAARYPITRALGDVDALATDAVQQRGGLVPADLANVRAAAAQAAAIDERQAERIAAVQARLR